MSNLLLRVRLQRVQLLLQLSGFQFENVHVFGRQCLQFIVVYVSSRVVLANGKRFQLLRMLPERQQVLSVFNLITLSGGETLLT